MPAAAADRFSDLPDDLLVHVISFLPVTDAARTSALSRRWRPLWLHTGTLNLDSTSYREPSHSHTTIHRRIRRCLFRDAASALASRNRNPAPVTRLTVLVEGDGGGDCQKVLGSKRMDALLGDPALRRVEELRVGFMLAKETDLRLRFIYKMPPLGTLPAMAAALRVLDLDYCYLDPPAPHAGAAVLFPRLASLRLDRCSMPAPSLAALIRAAPNLAALHIQRHDLDGCSDDSSDGEEEKDRLDLHCPNLTELTLADLDRLTDAKPIHVFVPRLRVFSYSGHFTEFFMKADAPNLTRVDLKFCSFNEVINYINNVPVLVWRFLGALRHTKAMRLAVRTTDDITLDRTGEEDETTDDIALDRTGEEDEHLTMLPRLERLEFEADFDGGDTERAAATIRTLVQCCPVIRDLKLQLTHSWDWVRCCLGKRKRDESELEIEMDLFERRRRSDEIALMLDDSLGVVDLHDLTGCWFNCLGDRLKNVELQFMVDLHDATSFEIRRAKFFGEKLKALEVRASN